jgi:CheY-like chemotaxis protein
MMVPAHRESSSPQAAESYPVAGRVLVVDDERAIRELFQRILLFEGFDVVLASGGAEGLRLLGTDPRIALVLLDLDMPAVDGRRFRLEQCEDPRLAGVPTVIVTGTVVTPEISTELQATDYLNKPVARSQFVQVVERYCSRIGDSPLPSAERPHRA